MNFFSTSEIFVVVLFAYYEPTQVNYIFSNRYNDLKFFFVLLRIPNHNTNHVLFNHQGETFAVSEVALWNGQTYITDPLAGRYTYLIHSEEDNTYKIKEGTNIAETFGINNIFTMIEKLVVVRNNANLYFLMELQSSLSALRFFDLTARPTLFEKVSTICSESQKYLNVKIELFNKTSCFESVI